MESAIRNQRLIEKECENSKTSNTGVTVERGNVKTLESQLKAIQRVVDGGRAVEQSLRTKQIKGTRIPDQKTLASPWERGAWDQYRERQTDQGTRIAAQRYLYSTMEDERQQRADDVASRNAEIRDSGSVIRCTIDLFQG